MSKLEGPNAVAEARVTGPKPKSSPVGLLAVMICVVSVVVAGVWWVRKHNPTSEAVRGGPNARGGQAPMVPVVSAKAAKKDMPIYLDGLGTVQAINLVTVHVRVDGELKKVAFTEGQDVGKGDILAQIDPDPYQTTYDQAVAKITQDQATLDNARLDLKRYTTLAADKISSQQQFDTQKNLVSQLEGLVGADKAALSNAAVQLNYATVRAPIDGRTGIRQVDAGNIVHANDTNGLVVITQLRPIGVLFTLQEQTLWDIQQQMKQGQLSVLVVDRDNTNVLARGKLSVIDNEIDTTTATIKLKAVFPNDDLRLWPGQFVNTRLLLTTRKNATVVPAPVVQRGPDGAYAFVIATNDVVEVRKITVFPQFEGGLAVVESGLKPGEKVVVDGQYKLQAGSKVKQVTSTKGLEEEPEP
jgi:multidrug efflux system membrane fusion protein